MRKILLDDIYYRDPYYIQCSICEKVLAHSDARTLCDITNMMGWKYDDERDLIYCPDCYWERSTEKFDIQNVKFRIVPISKMRTKNDLGDFYDNYIIALDVGNLKYSYFILVHKFLERIILHFLGITDKDVDLFEKEKERLGSWEKVYELYPKARIFINVHDFVEQELERRVVELLGENWIEYNNFINKVLEDSK